MWLWTNGCPLSVLYKLSFFVSTKCDITLGVQNNVCRNKMVPVIKMVWSYSPYIRMFLLVSSHWFLLLSLLTLLFYSSDHPGVSLCTADSQVIGESERSREQILQTLSDLSRGFQDIADRCLLVLHLEVRYVEKESQKLHNSTYVVLYDCLLCIFLLISPDSALYLSTIFRYLYFMWAFSFSATLNFCSVIWCISFIIFMYLLTAT